MMKKEEIERIKEERREEIRKTDDGIGLVVIQNYHKKDCQCIDCLTQPEPFFPHPEIHKKFVDCIFKAVKG